METDSLPSHCLSVRKAAEYFGVAPAKVRRWIRRGLLRAFDVGERRVELRIPPDAINQFMERQAVVKPRPRLRQDDGIDPEIAAMLDA